MMEIFARGNPALLSFLRSEGANVEAIAVAEGANPGWIFVDDPGRPAAALVWSKGNLGFYWVGKVSGALGVLLEACLIPRLQAHGLGALEISCADAREDEALVRALGDRESVAWRQSVFRFSGVRGASRAAGDVQAIAAALAGGTLRNDGFVRKELLERWESIERFARDGAGFCSVLDGQAVSLCYTGWAAGDIRAFSVETQPGYRRQGRAEGCARALIRHCLENGLTPHWECAADNAASRQLAEKIGFSHDYDYRCYGFRIGENKWKKKSGC